MIHHPLVSALALGVLISAGLACQAADDTACVTLDEPTLARLGIATIRAQPVQRATRQQALLQVLDPSALVTLLADLWAARAASDASTREVRRLEGLVSADFSAAPRELEAMRAQAIANASLVQSLQARLDSSWGQWFAQMDSMREKALVADLASGKQLIARIDAIGRSTTPGGAISIVFDGSEQALEALDIGSAKTSDTRLQSLGRMLLLRVSDTTPLAAGQTFAAHVAGPAQLGELLPDAALVRWNALTWVYVQGPDDCFERRAIGALVPVADGVLLPQGTLGEARVVSVGAEALLAKEFSSTLPEPD